MTRLISKITLIRSVGWLQLLVSLGFAVVAIYGLASAADMASLLSLVAEAHDEALSAPEWGSHWRIACLTMLASSLAGGLAAVGLLRARRWGAALTAGTLSALLTAEMLATVTGYARYDYEVLSAGGVVLFVVLIALSGMVYLRWPHFHR